MKMIYGGVPVNSLKVKHYEVSTADATTVPSAVQAGLTYYANGQKQTGTGKSFEFAYYGQFETNDTMFIPSVINVVEISSLMYPIQLTISLSDMKYTDFSVEQSIGNVIVDNIAYPIRVIVANNRISITCDQTIPIEVFYGKDNYI